MTKNPKVIAGIIGIVVLLAGCIVLATYMIPTIKEVQREMSLTPTPLPPVPDTVREKPAESMVTPEPVHRQRPAGAGRTQNDPGRHGGRQGHC